jgi:cytochrome c oxidase assembly protein subunit 15
VKLISYTKVGIVLSILSILAGAFVRATGSGDGCGSTWPTCKGKIIPQLSDTSEVIEFSHRSISGILLIVTLIIFIKSRNISKGTIVRTTVNFLTFFVVFEAAIGAVIVLYEWVGLNSSLPRIIAVPIHLVNTFGLLACYAVLYKVLLNNFKNIKQLWDRRFVFVAFLFLLSGATGSITALADVLFPSTSFYEGLMEDFDRTSELLTRLRILHPIVATGLSVALIIESRKIQKDYKIDVKFLQILVIVAVTLGVLNVLSNILLLLSIFHLAIADLLWITYIYVSMDKIKNKSAIN